VRFAAPADEEEDQLEHHLRSKVVDDSRPTRPFLSELTDPQVWVDDSALQDIQNDPATKVFLIFLRIDLFLIFLVLCFINFQLHFVGVISN